MKKIAAVMLLVLMTSLSADAGLVRFGARQAGKFAKASGKASGTVLKAVWRLVW